MQELSLASYLSSIVAFVFIYILTLLGAFMRELFLLDTKQQQKVDIIRVIYTSVIMSVVMFFCQVYIVNKVGSNFYHLGCFLLGLTGYKYIAENIDGLLDKVLEKHLPGSKSKDTKPALNTQQKNTSDVASKEDSITQNSTQQIQQEQPKSMQQDTKQEDTSNKIGDGKNE